MSELNNAIGPDDELVKRLVQIWTRRATVRSNEFDFSSFTLPEEVPDYPSRLVPFWNHPKFERVDQGTRAKLLTYAWIAYNKRTITAEEHVANPGFGFLLSGRIAGFEKQNYKTLTQQSLIDEHFHTLMHMHAIEQAYRFRDVSREVVIPHSITFRTLTFHLNKIVDLWEKDLLVTIFAIVSEISINTFLDLIALDREIVPSHAKLAELHARDESAHSLLLEEGCLYLYDRLDIQGRSFFKHYLPIALECFLAQDFSVWEVILETLNIEGRREILEDTIRSSAENRSLSRDYSALQKLCRRLGIQNQIEFIFA